MVHVTALQSLLCVVLKISGGPQPVNKNKCCVCSSFRLLVPNVGVIEWRLVSEDDEKMFLYEHGMAYETWPFSRCRALDFLSTPTACDVFS